MSDIKKKYLKVKEFVESLGSDELNFFQSNSFYEEDFTGIRDLIYLEKNISESKFPEYILGDKVATIESISEFMVKKLNNHLSNYTTENEEERYYEEDDYQGDYDSAGYYHSEAVKKLVNFFTNLDHGKILSITNGSYEDYYELDLNGGRWYFIDHSGIQDLIFSYLYYGKKELSFGDSIYNTTNLNEDLEGYYSFRITKVEIPSQEKLNSIYKKYLLKKYEKDFSRYNSFVDNIIRNFENDPIFSDLISEMKKLRADDDYIKKKIENV
jgi:hypothetical protein